MITAELGSGQRLIKGEPKTLIWSEPLPGGGRAVVKMYLRRPFFDPVRRWILPYRAEREFRLLAYLHQNDLPCAEPLWWSHGRDPVHGRHELLATREIAGAVPLVDMLRAAGRAPLPDLTPLFRIARRLHECGVSHGAFYPTNILVTAPASRKPAFHVVDMAHGCRFASDIVGTRPAEFDLLDMMQCIARKQPLMDCALSLVGYGLDVRTSERLMTRLRDHRLERPWRHLRRAETDSRVALNLPGQPRPDG